MSGGDEDLQRKILRASIEGFLQQSLSPESLKGPKHSCKVKRYQFTPMIMPQPTSGENAAPLKNATER